MCEARSATSASALSIRGKAEIRDRAALVTVDDRSPVLHSLDPEAATKVNTIARQITDTSSLDEVERVTTSIRGTTELVHERHKASTTDRTKPTPGRDELASRYADYRERSRSRGPTLLTFRRIGEVIGLHDYQPELVRSITGPDAHPLLGVCLL